MLLCRNVQLNLIPDTLITFFGCPGKVGYVCLYVPTNRVGEGGRKVEVLKFLLVLSFLIAIYSVWVYMHSGKCHVNKKAAYCNRGSCISPGGLFILALQQKMLALRILVMSSGAI